MTEMNTAWTAASEEIYKAQAAAGGAAQPQGEAQQPSDNGNDSQGQPNAENVTDAEFEEVK